MAHDGTEGLSPDGWLPDRLSVGMLTKAFPPELVDRVVDVTDTREERRRLLPSRLVVYFVLALWLFRGRNCGYGQVMSKLVDALYHHGWAVQLLEGLPLEPAEEMDPGTIRRRTVPNISSLSRARARIGAAPLHMLFDEVAGPVGAEGAPGVFVCGLRMISMDTATTELPGTDANNAAFGRPPDAGLAGAYPQVRWVAAAESGTGALVGAAFGPYTAEEQELVGDLLSAFDPGMLVLAGRGFPSYALVRDVLATGAHILWRIPDSFALRRFDGFDDYTILAELRPTRPAGGPPIRLRVIEYQVDATPASRKNTAGYRPEQFRLVTDLLDIAEFPARDLARAYPARWRCERVIGHHETDMGTGQPAIRSKDPEGVAQEMWALFAVYQATHPLLGGTVDVTGISPERVRLPYDLLGM